MEVTFRNYETNKDITLNSEKSLLVIYGKNGSGKTTLSRNNYFDKNYVFNEDFVFSNVYNITEAGASQTASTKEKFSGLWLGEDIVKIRKEISDILEIEKKIKIDFQMEQTKLLDFFAKNQIQINIYDKIKELNDKDFCLNLEKYDEQKKNYVSTLIFKTDITDKEKFIEKLTYYRKNDIYNMLVSKIKASNLLSELIFADIKGYIDNINMRISLLSKQKEIIDEVEKIYKDEEITNDLKEKIHDWYEIHKDKNKCAFCGNTNIEDAKTKWKKVFLNEYIDCKNKLIKELKADLNYCEIIINEKQFAEVDKGIIDTISKLIIYLKKYIEDTEKNVFSKFEYKVEFVKKEIVELNDLINNLVNYVLNKKKDVLGFYHNSQQFVEKLKKEKLELTDKLMDEKGIIIADSINKKFEKFGLNKNIKIIVDKRSTPHKFTYSIENHSNINELSDGQKHKLALAIFMNYLENHNLKGKTIVIDDPVVSLDISSYILFKQYLLNDLIIQKFDVSTKLILLTHDITYLYIQLSNIFENQHMRDITQVFKLNGVKIEEIPLDFIKTDDITLFREALDNLTNITELRILNAIINKIFRIEIDLKLRFFGLSLTDKIGIEELKIDEDQKKIIRDYGKHIVETSRRNHPTDSDIQQSLLYLKETSDILGFNDFITDNHIENINKIVNEQIDGPINSELFNLIDSVKKFLKSDNNDDFKNYIEHTRNSYTRNLIGLGLDDYFN